MAYSKIILNGETLMDVTSDTVDADGLVDGVTATKNDGTKVEGTILPLYQSGLVVNGREVTVPAGYYTFIDTSINVSSTTHPNPTATIASSTGVVTAQHVQGTGYVTGGTTTGTLNLTTQAAQTINTSTADQTIASYRWLTGTQTIKSVTTTNLTAANIAEGVTVKVGDANNASRITQVTGTHSGETQYTATISGSGNSSYCYVTYNSTKYYSNNGTFSFKAGDTLTIYCRGNNVSINGEPVTLSSYNYTYTLPVGDITINLSYSSSTSNNINIYGLVKPEDTYEISSSGTFNVYGYSQAWVPSGAAATPAKTITTNPTMTLASTTGVVTAAYNGSSSITPTITSGYVTAGTAGTVSTTGTSTFQLTSKAAATYNTSTADQTIASYRWLTGTQTIKSVTTSNLTAANIASGVVVKVGDANNASRISQVTGTFAGGASGRYKCYITTGSSDSHDWVQIYPTGTTYSSTGDTFDFDENTTIRVGAGGNHSYGEIYLDGSLVADSGQAENTAYNFTPNGSFDIEWDTSDGHKCYITTYKTGGGDGFTADDIATRMITGDISGNATTISSYAFYYCTSLTTASFPSATTIGTCAFYICSNLTNISFPNATTIGVSAFYKCNILKVASFPSATAIGESAFCSCSSLTTISFPNVTTTGSYVFGYCTSLTTADFPNLLIASANAFRSCKNLTVASFPKLSIISTYMFYSCSNLTTLSFPSATTVGNYAFGNCFRLLSLYLLGSSVASLGNVNAFGSTPISTYTTQTGGVYGSIYVPSSLYNSYITAAIWSVYSSRFVSV